MAKKIEVAPGVYKSLSEIATEVGISRQAAWIRYQNAKQRGYDIVKSLYASDKTDVKGVALEKYFDGQKHVKSFKTIAERKSFLTRLWKYNREVYSHGDAFVECDGLKIEIQFMSTED
ncbi:hypothetical protein [Gimesia maris]|uniref:hypothetical protein n=1 Tax=Gimesia maris TaxID=122 RepID=UPI0032EC712F